MDKTTMFVRASNYDALEQRVRELEGWVSDLQSGMYVNCVYCGHRYGPSQTTAPTMSEALKLHIEQCKAHPMSALKAENERLRDLAVRAWGVMNTHAARHDHKADRVRNEHMKPYHSAKAAHSNQWLDDFKAMGLDAALAVQP
jgi:hypothetical protein